MAQIVTITNPLTGQPTQVDQLEHTAQQIDDAIARAIPGGAIDIALANNDPRNWGLGTDAVDAPDHDANNINTSGLFRAYLNCPIDGAGWWLIKSETFNVDKYQWAIHYRSSGGYSVDIIAFRSCVAGVYQPWEFLNPPMELGKEYRTTERYKGKPVYAQYFTLGTFPTGGASWIDYPSTVSGIVDLVRYSGSTGSNLTPYKDNNNVYNISPARTRAMVYCNDSSGSNYTINLTLWYTKT